MDILEEVAEYHKLHAHEGKKLIYELEKEIRELRIENLNLKIRLGEKDVGYTLESALGTARSFDQVIGYARTWALRWKKPYYIYFNQETQVYYVSKEAPVSIRDKKEPVLLICESRPYI